MLSASLQDLFHPCVLPLAAANKITFQQLDLTNLGEKFILLVGRIEGEIS